MTTLLDLPYFEVVDVLTDGPLPVLAGRFTEIEGVAGRGWLYAATQSVIGDLHDVDPQTFRAMFTAPYWQEGGPIHIGAKVPWFTDYWQPYHVTMIVEPTSPWEAMRFTATPAQFFREGTSVGWMPLGDRPPDGAELLHVDPVGWSHEHCEICGASISARMPVGYRNGENRWLCEECYERYAACGNLDFVVGR